MNIYPSILSDSLEEIQKQLNLVAGRVETVQIDIVDALFADEITVMPEDLKELDFQGLNVDIHLLVNEPEDYIQACTQLANIRTVIAQVEHMSSQKNFVNTLLELNVRAGLSLDIYTPIFALDSSVLEKLSLVQVMSIHSGAQGRPFEHVALGKIQELASVSKKNQYMWDICVDGGINTETALMCKKAGATSCAVGSFLWTNQDISQSLLTFSQI